MRPIALLLALSMGASALAGNPPDWLVGSYRLELSPDLKAATEKLGIPEPYARILLRPDGTFSYANNTAGNVSGANGTYELNERRIRLTASDLFPAKNVKTLSGKVEENALEIDGLRYVKVGANPARVPAAAPATFDVTGTWNVRNGDQIDRSIKMIFKENHTFEFNGMNASSKGRFDIEGDRLTLRWTEVDGEAVEPGMQKVIFLRDDGCFFIDSYRYVRS